MARRPETSLQIVVAQFLDYALPPGAIWTAIDAGATKLTPQQADLQRRRGIKPHWPDVLILYQGKLCGIELKAKQGRLGDEQEALGMAIIAAGGDWFEARSIADIERTLRNYGFKLRATEGTRFERRTA